MPETKLTREEIELRIAGITAELKGPLPYFERAMLAEDRRDLRKLLENANA